MRPTSSPRRNDRSDLSCCPLALLHLCSALTGCSRRLSFLSRAGPANEKMVAPETSAASAAVGGEENISYVDVAIIGAGPAGCMVSSCWLYPPLRRREARRPTDGTRASLQALDVLSRYSDRGLTVRCFDKRTAKLDNGTWFSFSEPDASVELSRFGIARAGQADGLNSRTLEIFESLGFIEKVQKEGSPMVNSASLFPSTRQREERLLGLARAERDQFLEPGSRDGSPLAHGKNSRYDPRTLSVPANYPPSRSVKPFGVAPKLAN